ncbi:SGNH/GDSL hydrolase family protein [Aquihabitans sp. McL0605]|uniref:SGNH/GDSL hydrolase family protein n=1 Tax=Aquihabitans sp. McL0605 TaxID=3415671 RepID=UPI003CECD952
MSASDRPGARVAVVIVVVAIAAVGIWFWRRPAPIAPGILFVGDSVTYMSTKQLDEEMHSDSPEVLARVGFTSSDMLPLVTREVDRRAKDDELRQVAVLIGYNDVLKQHADSPALARVMALANRFDCAVWLTLPPIPLREKEVAEWNRRVAETAGSYPHVHVVDDWRKAVEAAPLGELITRRDGVHPTPGGAKRLSEIYTDAVHRVC